MKLFWGILIGILLYVSSLLHATGVAEYPPTLRRGSLDLRNWDFSTQRIVRVQGEAEFYWNQLRYPTQGTAFVAPLPSTVFQVPENVEYARIPAAWNTLPGRNYPPFGYATYRLLVYLPPDLPVWGIYMSNQDTSYRLYANGRVVSENGTVGTTRDTSIPHRRPVLLFLPANKEGMELIVQVSNFQHRWGGLNNSILIGLPEQILAVNRFYYAYFLVLFGGFLLLSLFHGVQYTFRPSDRSHLFLAASALVLSLRLVFTGEYLAYQFFPRIPWELGIKYEYLSMPLFLSCFTGS